LQSVVFDSSFLISVVERPTTWYEDMREKIGAFKPVMLDSTRAELARLASKGGKRGGYASLAAELGSNFERTSGVSSGSADDNVLSWAAENEALVATMDREMLRHLRALGMRYVTLRGRRVYVW
jgi:rRNA-processing protein FCF1